MESCHRQKRNYGGEKRAPERLVEEGSLHGGMWKDSLHGYDTLSGAMEYTCVQPCDNSSRVLRGREAWKATRHAYMGSGGRMTSQRQKFCNAKTSRDLVEGGRGGQKQSLSLHFRFLKRQRSEPITGPTHSLKIAGFLWLNLNLLAQPSDMDIHGARGYKAIAPPNLIQQAFARKDASWMRSQKVE